MTQPAFSEDDRFQIEFTAQQVEQRNRSMRLFVLGVLVLLFGAIFWIWGWSAKGGAIGDLRAKQNQLITVEGMLGQIEAMRTNGVDNGRAGEVIERMGTRIKAFADMAGIENLPIPDESSSDAAGGRLRVYRYDDVKSRSIKSIVQWLATATDPEQGINGLELYSLSIRPQNAREEWSVNVTFRRWERAQ